MSEDVSGAVVPAVDHETAKRLLAEYEAQAESTRRRGKVYAQHLEDYRRLESTLASISDTASVPSTMIPVSKKAYFEGELQHTNEITVLLGDNWFAERSAKQAKEICQRRMEQCAGKLRELDKELTLVESWSREASALAIAEADGGGNMEIQEPFDEAEELEWKGRHRESVRRHKLVGKDGQDAEDEELFGRLDELEIEEELLEYEKREEVANSHERDGCDGSIKRPAEKHDKNAQDEELHELEIEEELLEDGEEDWSESPELSDSESSEEGDTDAAAAAAVNKANYHTVPDPSRAKLSRFSVSQVVCPEAAAQKAREERRANLKPRPRRVSFGSNREYLYSLNPPDGEEAAAAGGRRQARSPSESSNTNDEPPPAAADRNIYFIHHAENKASSKEGSEKGFLASPNDPSDLLKIYGSKSKVKLKSILKPAGSSHSLSSFDDDSASTHCGRFSVSSTKAGSLSPMRAFPEDIPRVGQQQPLAKKPVSELVVETKVVRNNDACDGKANRKQSRFKLSRVELN